MIGTVLVHHDNRQHAGARGFLFSRKIFAGFLAWPLLGGELNDCVSVAICVCLCAAVDVFEPVNVYVCIYIYVCLYVYECELCVCVCVCMALCG